MHANACEYQVFSLTYRMDAHLSNFNLDLACRKTNSIIIHGLDRWVAELYSQEFISTGRFFIPSQGSIIGVEIRSAVRAAVSSKFIQVEAK
tara:strand:+ start:768 stop:1040 length:273 start_codon:yes stop_codon:yes gene_type:complete